MVLVEPEKKIGQVISIIIGVQDSPLILAYSRDQTSRLIHGRHFFFLFYNKILMLRDMSGKMRWSVFTQAPNLSLCTPLPLCLEWPYSKELDCVAITGFESRWREGPFLISFPLVSTQQTFIAHLAGSVCCAIPTVTCR